MGTLLIKGGHILDPAQNLDQKADLLIENGLIATIDTDLDRDMADEVVDVTGALVTPGLVDIHVHLREPGREDAETIYTGTRAAAAGGFTSICPMPNTKPVVDSQSGVNHIRQIAHRDAATHLYPVASVTVGQMGEEIVEFGDIYKHGAVAFSDDGRAIMNAEIMRRALQYVSMFDLPILAHEEDYNLSANGAIHEGHVSTLTGLKGIPSCAEAIQIARDIELADFTHAKLHIQHVSSLYSAELVRTGKRRRVNVSAEVTPHHLTLTETACLEFNTNAKMSPPLRSEADRRALIEALNDGVIDIIATDHAPHTVIEKDLPFTEAPNGVIGMETAFPVLYTELVQTGQVPLGVIIRAMTVAPAQRLKLPAGALTPGAVADVAVFDLNAEREVNPDAFLSKARNCPWNGRRLRGWPILTIVCGDIIYREGEMLV